MLPVEDIAADGVPADAVGEADSVGGGEDLFRDEQFWGFAVVAADLVDAESDAFVLVGVLALDDQDGDAIDEEDDVLSGGIATVGEGPLFGDLVGVPGRVVVANED